MKNTHARMPLWTRICGLVLALGPCAGGLDSASAEPSAECRELAVQFGTAAAALDLGALAVLMRCVSDEIQDRTRGTAPAPPPSPPEAAPPPPPPPPPPSPPSGRISSFRQAWPESAPWGREWSSEGWGD